jgi:hypothetical protein
MKQEERNMLVGKANLMLALCLTCGSAIAHWTLITRSEDDSLKVFVNYSSISSVGNKVLMWNLVDYNDVQKIENESFLSKAVQQEYDCIDETIRTLTVIKYQKHMAVGEATYSYNVYALPTPISTYSLSEDLLKVACDIK